MRYRQRRLSGRARLGLVLLIIIAVLLAAALIKADKAIKPVAAKQAEHYSRLTASRIISSAVSEYLNENRFSYDDLAAVLYDENRKAASIEAVTYNINRIQSELSLMINTRFMESSAATAEIPIGSFTGSYLLAGKGPSLRLRICPARDAQVKLTSSFESAGMNQTCHRISAVITAEISSSLPLYEFSTEASFEFLIAENIIIGEIPETALDIWTGRGA